MDVSNQLYLALWFFRDLQGMSRILSQCLLCQMVPPSQGDLKSSLKSKCLFCAPHLRSEDTGLLLRIEHCFCEREKGTGPAPSFSPLGLLHPPQSKAPSSHQVLFWGSWCRHRYSSTPRQSPSARPCLLCLPARDGCWFVWFLTGGRLVCDKVLCRRLMSLRRRDSFLAPCVSSQVAPCHLRSEQIIPTLRIVPGPALSSVRRLGPAAALATPSLVSSYLERKFLCSEMSAPCCKVCCMLQTKHGGVVMEEWQAVSCLLFLRGSEEVSLYSQKTNFLFF